MLPPILTQSRQVYTVSFATNMPEVTRGLSPTGRVFHVCEGLLCFLYAVDTSKSRKRSADEVDDPDTQLKASKAPKRTSPRVRVAYPQLSPL